MTNSEFFSPIIFASFAQLNINSYRKFKNKFYFLYKIAKKRHNCEIKSSFYLFYSVKKNCEIISFNYIYVFIT